MKDRERTTEQLIRELAGMRQQIAELQVAEAQRKGADETLRALVEGTASVTGDDFFRSLVFNLAAALQVRYAFVSEFMDENTRARTLASWTGGGFLDSFIYDLAGTPCEQILRGETRHYAEGVQALFPKDEYLVKLGAESYLAMPLIDQSGNVLGTLAVIDDKPMSEDPRNMSIFRVFAARAGAELVRKQTEADLKARAGELALKTERLTALATLSRTVSASLDLQDVLDLVTAATVRLLSVNLARLWLWDPDREVLRLRASYGDPDLVAYPWQLSRLGEGISGLAFARREILVTDAAATDARFRARAWAAEKGVHAQAGVPMLIADRPVGVLTVTRRDPIPFQGDELTLLSSVAAQAAVAVENARLYEQLKEMSMLEERERIAREMHDGLGQQLGCLHLELGKLERDFSSQPGFREELRRLKKVAAGAYEEVRQAIFGLKMMVSRSLGLVPTLTEYLHDFGQQTGIAVELNIADERGTRLSTHAEVQLVRIIQEALANVRKHAHVKRARIIFDTEAGKAKITVHDDGRGFDPEEVTRFERVSLGLQSMRERAELVGGKLKVESRRGKGTQLIVWLPIQEEEIASWRS